MSSTYPRSGSCAQAPSCSRPTSDGMELFVSYPVLPLPRRSRPSQNLCPISSRIRVDICWSCRQQNTVKPVLSPHSKRRPRIGFQDRFLLNAGQKYCRMLQGEHSAILSTFIKLPFVIKIFVLSIFDWPLKTGFTIQ